MTREDAVEIRDWFENIDKCVLELQKYKSNGKSVFVNFNGNRLYSCDVTMDDAYLRVCGVTKAEYDANLEEHFNAKTKEEAERIKRKFFRMKRRHTEEKKSEAIQAPDRYSRLEDNVKYLMDCRARGESVYLDFENASDGKIVRLYSWDVSMDEAFLQVTGLTKEELGMARKEMRAAETPEQKKAVEEKYDALERQHAREAKERELLELAVEIEDYEAEISAYQEKINGLRTRVQDLTRDDLNEQNGPGENV